MYRRKDTLAKGKTNANEINLENLNTFNGLVTN